jgi:hypothetical protein
MHSTAGRTLVGGDDTKRLVHAYRVSTRARGLLNGFRQTDRGRLAAASFATSGGPRSCSRASERADEVGTDPGEGRMERRALDMGLGEVLSYSSSEVEASARDDPPRSIAYSPG